MRLHNALERAGFCSISSIATVPDKTLLSVSGVGPNSLKLIRKDIPYDPNYVDPAKAAAVGSFTDTGVMFRKTVILSPIEDAGIVRLAEKELRGYRDQVRILIREALIQRGVLEVDTKGQCQLTEG